MKTEYTLQFKVTEQEKKLIEKSAKDEGTTVSKYVRGSVLSSMALDGNIEAIKILATIVRDKVFSDFRRRIWRSQTASE